MSALDREQIRRLIEQVNELEARLAKVPALVDALRYCARPGAADSGTARKALAEWELERIERGDEDDAHEQADEHERDYYTDPSHFLTWHFLRPGR